MSQDRESELRRSILDQVRTLIKERLASDSFSPGKSAVRYAGRVYDDDEVVRLVGGNQIIASIIR